MSSVFRDRQTTQTVKMFTFCVPRMFGQNGKIVYCLECLCLIKGILPNIMENTYLISGFRMTWELIRILNWAFVKFIIHYLQTQTFISATWPPRLTLWRSHSEPQKASSTLEYSIEMRVRMCNSRGLPVSTQQDYLSQQQNNWEWGTNQKFNYYRKIVF